MIFKTLSYCCKISCDQLSLGEQFLLLCGKWLRRVSTHFHIKKLIRALCLRAESRGLKGDSNPRLGSESAFWYGKSSQKGEWLSFNKWNFFLQGRITV